MYSIGPGRNSEMPAMMCSNLLGCISINMRRMPAPSTWNRPSTSPRDINWNAARSLTGNVVEIQIDAVILLDQIARLAHDGQRREAEEVHLQQPDRFDDAHFELRDRFERVVAFLGGASQRRVFHQRPIGDHHPGGMRADVAHRAFHRLRRIEQRLRPIGGVVHLLEFGNLLDRFADLHGLAGHGWAPASPRDRHRAAGCPARGPCRESPRARPACRT